MEIVLYKTSMIPATIFLSYVKAYNRTFRKQFDREFFLKKYKQTVLDNSYHAFLIHNDDVVAAQSAIPYEYMIDEEKKIVCLSVDIFVLSRYRNPAVLYKLYLKLRERLVQEGVFLVLGVPNANAYLYQKNILKFKDVGDLPYYVLPVKIGKVTGKFWFPNFLNVFLAYLIASMHSFLVRVCNPVEELTRFKINRNNDYVEKQRYSLHHKVFKGEATFAYTIVDEEGVRAAYLIDFYNVDRKKDGVSLTKAVSYILKKEQVDIILFVGTLYLRQWVLFRVPYKLEPKHLHLVGDILNVQNEKKEKILDLKNWEFGLFNYDVR